jgi:hypothetical protein
MHRPVLTLRPGASAKVGLGGWNSVPLTVVLELGIFGAGLVSYLRQTTSRDRVGAWALVLWLFVPLFAWGDRHRSAA